MQNHLAQPNRLTFAIDEETNEEFILNALLPIRISMPVSIWKKTLYKYHKLAPKSYEQILQGPHRNRIVYKPIAKKVPKCTILLPLPRCFALNENNFQKTKISST